MLVVSCWVDRTKSCQRSPCISSKVLPGIIRAPSEFCKDCLSCVEHCLPLRDVSGDLADAPCVGIWPLTKESPKIFLMMAKRAGKILWQVCVGCQIAFLQLACLLQGMFLFFQHRHSPRITFKPLRSLLIKEKKKKDGSIPKECPTQIGTDGGWDTSNTVIDPISHTADQQQNWKQTCGLQNIISLSHPGHIGDFPAPPTISVHWYLLSTGEAKPQILCSYLGPSQQETPWVAEAS